MNKIFNSLLIGICVCLGVTSCKVKTPPAVEERERWISSLNDSIQIYEKQRSEIEHEITGAREKVGGLVGYFDYVSNPRHVEGFYIFEGWKNRYPLQKTALVARVTEDERFELIATLIGAHFNEIGVTAAGETVSSEVVPHDQAMNYRAGNLNTVYFSGEKAEEIGRLIANNSTEQITVTYLNGNRTGSLNLPSDEKQMIARTWELYSAQKNLHNYEKELPRLSGKISACRRILDAEESTTEDN